MNCDLNAKIVKSIEILVSSALQHKYNYRNLQAVKLLIKKIFYKLYLLFG